MQVNVAVLRARATLRDANRHGDLSRARRSRSCCTPNEGGALRLRRILDARPLSALAVRASDAPLAAGAELFHDKACLSFHSIDGNVGRRGPDLSDVADRLTRENMVLRIANGATYMPSYASSLTPKQIDLLVGFLTTRTRT